MLSGSLTLILLLFALSFPGDVQERGEETIKYFKTRLQREDILENEITVEEARRANHFKAVYNHQGELIRVEFVPNGDRLRKPVKKRELFPKPKPPFRYFESWNYHTRELAKEMPEFRVGDRPYYRVTFLDTLHAKTVEYFMRRHHLLWTYYIIWDKNRQDSKLTIVFSTHQPLTALDPHLFHPTASEMRPGWVADFEYNRLGRPLEVTVRDPVGNTYYTYHFKHGFQTAGDTLHPVTNRLLTSEYYRSDGTRLGSHRLTFTETGSLVKKEFFDEEGILTETIEYIYNPELEEVSVVIRDPKGNILHREIIPR